MSIQSLARGVTPLFLATFLAGFCVPVVAQDVQLAGVALNEHVQLGGQRLLLNGAGVRTLFGFRVYVAALYLPAFTRESAIIFERDMPRRLQVTLLRDTSTEQNLSALKDGLLDNNSPAELEAIKGDVALFFSLIQLVHEVPAGTLIQLDYLPGAGTHLKFGGRSLGFVPGERFNRAILNVWLGRSPIQISLKKSLLGQTGPEG